jgi:hypothetical protein
MASNNDNELEGPIDELIGEVYDAFHEIPEGIIKVEGHTTLDAIRWETPYMEESWNTIRRVLLSLTPAQIERRKKIRRFADA